MTKRTFDNLTCDRCGLSESGLRTDLSSWWQAKARSRRKESSETVGSFQQGAGGYVDLCPECGSMLFAWMTRNGATRAASPSTTDSLRPADIGLKDGTHDS